MKHKFIYTSLFSMCFGLACAQIESNEGTVNIQQPQELEKMVAIYKNANANSGYYQIQVGFGDRNTAFRLKEEVDNDFPTWYSKIEFQEPTYRVRLGKFRDKLVADRKFLEVRKKYPRAMLLKIEKD